MTTNNLTELWKKGELKDGWYYLKDNGIFIDYYNGWNFNDTCACEIKELLAPVPSFEQWQQMKAFCEEFNALNVAQENQRLKSLLKDSREYAVNTPVYPQGDDNKQAEIHRLVDKINEVLK
jgi:hypothetical protein